MPKHPERSQHFSSHLRKDSVRILDRSMFIMRGQKKKTSELRFGCFQESCQSITSSLHGKHISSDSLTHPGSCRWPAAGGAFTFKAHTAIYVSCSKETSQFYVQNHTRGKKILQNQLRTRNFIPGSHSGGDKTAEAQLRCRINRCLPSFKSRTHSGKRHLNYHNSINIT